MVATTVFGQFRNQMPEWQLLDQAGRLAVADAVYEASDGWSHYYKESGNQLILSVFRNGQDIGEPSQQLRISSGLLSGFGQSAHDLSGADYIENSIWLTMNRYWRIEHANPIGDEVRVRFYYSTQDYNDLLSGLDEIGLEAKQSGELLFYALANKSIHPFSNRTEALGANFVPLQDTMESKATPWHREIYYVEFRLQDLNASGSGGYLIPVESGSHSLRGNIRMPDGQPLEGVQFASPISGAVVQTDAQGVYALGNIPAGRDYFLEPRLVDSPHSELSVLDMIALKKRLDSGEAFEDPYRELAADVDRSGSVDQVDLEILRRLIHGQGVLSPDRVWRFIPVGHRFREGRSPLFPAPPQNIIVNKVLTDQSGLDFIAVKAGNVASESQFPNDPPVLLDAAFSLQEVESCGFGETIEVPIEVSGFDDVMGFQFTIGWNPEVVEFVGIGDSGLPGFDESCFGMDLLRDGKLSVAWYTTSTSKRTRLSDGTSICTLQFRAIGQDQTQTPITFEKSPTAIQVLRKNLSTSNILFTEGSIRIKWETGIDVFEADIQHVSCFSNQDGAIDLQVEGSFGPYRFQWSNGSTEEDLDNLLPGAYFVTVSGRSKCPLVSDSLVVEEPRVLFVHNLNVRQIQCPGGNDGAISFRTSGGSPPYQFKWSNGSNNSWIGNLTEGSYAVTISDANGCRIAESFEIFEAPPLYINYSISPSSEGENGAIAVNDLLGSTPPQRYSWSNGATGPIVNGLAPGIYEVSIADAAFCNYLLKFEVPEMTSPSNLRAELVTDGPLQAGEMELLRAISPTDQTVQVRIFDSGSRMTWQKIVPLLRGENLMYIAAPSEPGSYLLQIQPRYDSVSSLRFTVSK